MTAIAEPLTGEAAAPSRLRFIGMLWRFARRKPLGGIAMVVIFIVVVVAVLAPVMQRYDPDFIFERENPNFKTNPTISELAANPDIGSPRTVDQFEAPSWEHWFGTDKVGHDIYSRVVWGTRLSLIVGLGASVIAVVSGLIIGTLSAFYLGWVDMLAQRFVDALQAFPALVLLLLLVQIAEPSVRNTVIALGAIGVPTTTRLIRSAALTIRTADYVDAARALGASDTRLLFRHILPNVFSVVLIAFSIGIGAYIIFEATISFLGVGPRGVVSWGKMVQEGRAALDLHPWLTVFAGGAIATVVVAFNLFGDALRDVLDPRLRGS